jgi:outer membrane protein assembly factor BamB
MRVSSMSSLHRWGAGLFAGLMLATIAPGITAAAAASTSPGERLWASRDNGPGDGGTAYALAVSPDGSTVYVTGGGYATVAYDASTGATLWGKRYNGPGNGSDYAYALGISPDGSTVFVTGTSEDFYPSPDWATVAYDAPTGAELWVRRYNGTYDTAPSALGVSPDGSTVFVTGAIPPGSGSGTDYGTVAYDASTGDTLWAKRFDGPANGYDQANGLGVSPDGSTVFVTGAITTLDDYADAATLAYDASTGATLWVTRYDGGVATADTAWALGVSPDGSTVYVTGGGSGSHADYATVAYDSSTGAQVWASTYNGPGNDTDWAYALGVSPDGSAVFVTGTSTGATGDDHDYATVAYDAPTGAELWVRRYNDPLNGDDVANALGVSPDGSMVFVTGQSGEFDAADYGTLAYDATTGATLWRRLDGTTDDDGATSLGVSPDGTAVYVTGWIRRDVNSDYGTIAYAT